MPRNRPSDAGRDRRRFLDLFESLVAGLTAAPPVTLQDREVARRAQPLAEYRAVSEIGPAHLGRWITILFGTYVVHPDPDTLQRMLHAATYGVILGPDGQRATAGRLVGFQPSTKQAMESVPYRTLVLQQGAITSPVEFWGGRPAIVSPRELS